MINLNVTKTILNENAEGYVDLSTAEEFELVSTTGCLTIIGTGKSKRLKLGKEIFEALGSPEAVGMKFMSNMLIIGQPEISKLKLTVAQDRIIYNNELARLSRIHQLRHSTQLIPFLTLPLRYCFKFMNKS